MSSNLAWPVLHAVLALLLISGCGAPGGPQTAQQPTALRLYSGAGLRAPVDEIVQAFRQKHNLAIECDYAGSDVLLSKLKLLKQGDLYIPGDEQYVDQAAAEGLVGERATLASQRPVILVKKDNPKGIRSLQDLAQPGLLLALGDEKACAIGKSTVALLKKNGIDAAAVEKNKVFNGMTVNELALQVKLGQTDATVVWDATAKLYAGQTEIVEIPAAQNIVSKVPIAVLSFSQQKDQAKRFLEFARSGEGREIFARHGYSPTPPQEPSR